jgi:hypothetical protein
MGRGRAKAKQTKVARALKYHSPETDLAALQRELGGRAYPGGAAGQGDSADTGDSDLYDEYGDELDESDDEDEADDGRWATRGS